MTFASIVILVAYAALISSPYLFRSYGRAKTDRYGTFAVGTRNFGWFRISAGLSATFIGGAAVINTASMGYTYGWFALTDAVSTSLALILSAFLVVPLLFRKRAFSLGSFLQGSGRMTTLVSGLLSTVFYTLVTAAQIVALVKILQPYFPFSPIILAAIATLGIAAYIVYGGYSAVTVTDVIQFVFMGICYFAVSGFFLLMEIPSTAAPPIPAKSMPLDFIFLLALPLLFVPISQDVHIRIHSAETKRDAAVGVLLAGLIYSLFGFISVSVGMSLASSGVVLASPDAAVPTFISAHFGSMAVIATIAILAAVMSIK
jgi:Na+/proline symporter